MNCSYLIQELNKESNLINQSIDAFLDSTVSEPRKLEFLRSQVLPVIEKDLAFQKNIVNQELERLLKDKDEKCKKTDELS